MKRFVVEYEDEIFWLYDDTEQNLLIYTDKVRELAEWIEQNVQEKVSN